MRRLLAPLVLAACFSGESTRGLPCTDDASCGDGLACVDDVCGGREPTPTYLSGLSVLFVVTDDPGSGALQARVAAAADPLIKVLDDADLDFRVGVISTAMSHPLCPPGGDGALLLTSCLDRLDDFHDSNVDVRSTACDMRCDDAVQGDDAVPAATEIAGTQTRPRPWIQHGPLYRDNFSLDGLEPNHLIGCFLPRGIVGCPYEQPLAALLRFLERMRDPMDDNYGFLGERGLLVVIFVGRGPECSFAADAAGIFDPGGAQAFWPDPAGDPSPAICWRAGAECTNLVDDRWFECHAVDRTVDGAPASPETAALVPVDTAADAVRAAVTELGAELLVAGVLGVPPEYDGGALDYREPMPDMPDVFGVAPGCVGDDDLAAAPPLRLHAFAGAAVDAAPGVPFITACIPDISVALTPFAKQLVKRMQTPLPPT